MVQPAQLTVRIVEECRTFRSHIDFQRTVVLLLQEIPSKYLAGLDRVVLRDSGGLTRYERKKRQRCPDKVLLGSYRRETKRCPAQIHLFIDAIAARWSGLWLRVPFLRFVLIARVLYHELGHHIHARIRPEYKEKEPTAEAWANRFTRELVEKRYWYLIPLLRPLARAVRRARRRRRKVV